MSVESAWRWL